MLRVIKVMFHMKINFEFMGKITEFHPKLSIFFQLAGQRSLTEILRAIF